MSSLLLPLLLLASACLAKPPPPSLPPGFNAFGHPDLNAFLAHAAQHAHPNSSASVCAVLGNEAADLDSIVSAIAMAFLLHSSLASSQCYFVPVINIPRGDLALRKDSLFLLAYVGIAVDSLVFIDDINLLELSRESRLKVVLTDHNALAAHQDFLSKDVIGILDHHFDEKKFDASKLFLKNVQMVGSACSLVALEFKDRSSDYLLSPNLAAALMGVITLDTRNFSIAENKFNFVDVEGYEYLLSKTGGEIENLFESLDHYRNDISGLTVPQLLRKDFKLRIASSIRYGISSVAGLSLENLYATAGGGRKLFEFMNNFANSRDLDFHCVLAWDSKDLGSSRELVCVSSDDELLGVVSDAVEKSGFAKLNEKPSISTALVEYFSPAESEDAETIKLIREWQFSVRLDAISSRKRISPFIQSAIKKAVRGFHHPTCAWDM